MSVNVKKTSFSRLERPPRMAGLLPSPQVCALRATVGTGYYGQVFRARDNMDGSTVAVKVSPMSSQNAAALLQKEISHLQRLTHPPIVDRRPWPFQTGTLNGGGQARIGGCLSIGPDPGFQFSLNSIAQLNFPHLVSKEFQ